MTVLFAVFVAVHRIILIGEAEPFDRVTVEAFGTFLVRQIQSGFLHPFETLRVRRSARLVLGQTVESLFPIGQVHAQVPKGYLVPVEAVQPQVPVSLVESRVLEIRPLSAHKKRLRVRSESPK